MPVIMTYPFALPAPQVSDPTELFLGNAGTAMRPLTAVVCAGKGEFVMDGTPRMRERPIVDLVDGLKQVGRTVAVVCCQWYLAAAAAASKRQQ